MTTIHLTHGEATASALRLALQTANRADRVITLSDVLAFGPLRDIDEAGTPGAALRSAFWLRLGGVPEALTARDCVELEAIEADDANVVVWHTDAAADQLTLRRVCYRLRTAPQRLNEVRLAASEIAGKIAGAPAPAPIPVAVRLADRLPDAAPISVLRISRLALEWQEVKFANGEIRRWRDNTFTSGTWADLDLLILDVLNSEPASWHAPQAVMSALPCTGPGAPVCEPVVLWRLRELAAAGELRLRDDMYAMRTASEALSRLAAARAAAALSLPR